MWEGVLGFDRMGIWGHLSDGTAVNTIHSVHAISAAGNGGFGGTLGGSAGGSSGCGSAAREREAIQKARVGTGAQSRAALATPGMLPREHTYDRSGLLLTAGDRGDVRLLRSPSLVAAAPAREGDAHCDRVACARFLNEGSQAVSAGRHDRIVVRWEISEDAARAVSGSGQGSFSGTRGINPSPYR